MDWYISIYSSRSHSSSNRMAIQYSTRPISISSSLALELDKWWTYLSLWQLSIGDVWMKFIISCSYSSSFFQYLSCTEPRWLTVGVDIFHPRHSHMWASVYNIVDMWDQVSPHTNKELEVFHSLLEITWVSSWLLFLQSSSQMASSTSINWNWKSSYRLLVDSTCRGASSKVQCKSLAEHPHARESVIPPVS